MDTGEKRIGLALSGPGGIVVGLPVVECRGGDADLDTVAAMARERGVEVVVVGLPLNMNGTEGPRALAAREFGEGLRARLGVPVEYADERLSSVEAEERLRGLKMDPKKKKAHVNTVAAQVILQQWMEGRQE